MMDFDSYMEMTMKQVGPGIAVPVPSKPKAPKTKPVWPPKMPAPKVPDKALTPEQAVATSAAISVAYDELRRDITEKRAKEKLEQEEGRREPFRS